MPIPGTSVGDSVPAPRELTRRALLGAGTAALGALAAPGVPAAVARPAGDGRKVIHVIGHSHIDAAWLWPWRDGAYAVLNTFRSALDRMRETPGFCFSHSSAAHYRWVQDSDPALFREVRQRIDEGRWEVVGGWPVEPDCNIPSGESLVRHALYGKAFMRQSLGQDVRIGFNPDSFGHAGGLPTILKAAAYDYYVFMRPMNNPALPLLFWWEGPDGSRVLSLRILENYSAPARMLPSVADKVFAPGFAHGAFFLGVGNHGGGVTREQVRQMSEFQKDPALPEIRWSTLQKFFEAVEESPAFANLPVVRHELQHVARGCYSSHAEVKGLNRRAEKTLGHAEAILAVARRAAGFEYPTAAFRDAWWKVAFNQFHDMLAGTALPAVYVEVRDGVGAACDTATTSQVGGLLTMAKRVDTSAVEESAVFLFNPLPWKRTALLEMQAETPSPVQDGAGSRPEPPTHLRGHDGSTVPIQWVNDLMPRMWMGTLVAQVELPPCGYRVFELAHGRPPAPRPWLDNCKPCTDRLGIASLLAADGRELLAGPISLVVIEDRSNAFGHGASIEQEFYLRQFRREAGRATFVSSKVVEDGPVLRITRQRARWKTSDIVLDIIQFRGHEEIELRLAVDWNEHGEMLKLEVPTAFSTPKVLAKTAASVTERRPDGDEQPYQDWVAVEGRLEGQDYTVGLLNKSTYSYDCLGGLLRTAVLRAVPFINRFSMPGPLSTRVPDDPPVTWMDQGRQERTFRLVPARGRWNEVALDRRAEGFHSPAEHVADSRHEGVEPWERSYLEVGPAGVAVLAVKRAEDGTGTIVRIQECAGVPTDAAVKSAAFGIDARVPLRPFELKTLLLTDTNELREVTLLEQPRGG